MTSCCEKRSNDQNENFKFWNKRYCGGMGNSNDSPNSGEDVLYTADWNGLCFCGNKLIIM